MRACVRACVRARYGGVLDYRCYSHVLGDIVLLVDVRRGTDCVVACIDECSCLDNETLGAPSEAG